MNLLIIIQIERKNVYKVFFRRIQSTIIYRASTFMRVDLMTRSFIYEYSMNFYLFTTRFQVLKISL